MTRVDVAFEDVQAGDLVTLSYVGHEFSGKAWLSGGGLRVGAAFLENYGGKVEGLNFVKASREVKLPTGIGAVVRDGDGDLFIRVQPDYWVFGLDMPDSSWYTDEILVGSGFSVLSDGVEID